ncbi:MAG: APC family permease [Lachnospiraceae bacterium]|nr:APC family permease [Lachnospiraceae bacterium]
MAGTNIYLVTIIIGTVFSILLFLINMRGLAAAASVQKVLCIILVGAAIIGAVFATVKGNFHNLQPIYDGAVKEGLTHSNFIGGCLAILATAPFFLAGFETIPQGIEEAGGDVKNVGKMVVLSVGLACVFYSVLLFCFGLGMPWEDFHKLNSPAAAEMFKLIYSGGLGTFLYWLITLGSIAGLFTTWNGFFMASASLLMAMGRASLIPSVFAKKDKNGVPRAGLIVCLILSLIGPFLGIGLIDAVTSFSAAAFVLSWLITSYCLIRLRKTMPNANRPFKIPGGLPMAWFAAIVSTVVFVLLFIPKNPVFMGSMAVWMFLGWMAVGIILYICNMGERKRIDPKTREENLYKNAK